jgi:hypothetical protein
MILHVGWQVLVLFVPLFVVVPTMQNPGGETCSNC